jgi:hypothetical protein
MGAEFAMAKDELGYDRIVERQLRGVAREVLAQVAGQGLPGEHHFYISFRTDHPGVSIGTNLRAQFPHEITIVLQHQFWGLEVGEDAFEVTLSFSGKHERLHVPFEALVSFSDPSVKFGLQFEPRNQSPEPSREEAAAKSVDKPAAMPKALPKSKPEAPADLAEAGAEPEGSGGDKASTVVALDAFRKKH